MTDSLAAVLEIPQIKGKLRRIIGETDDPRHKKEMQQIISSLDYVQQTITEVHLKCEKLEERMNSVMTLTTKLRQDLDSGNSSLEKVNGL